MGRKTDSISKRYRIVDRRDIDRAVDQVVMHSARKPQRAVNSGLAFGPTPAVVCQSATNAQTNPASQCDKFRPTIAGEIDDGEATKAGFHTARSSRTHLGFTGYEGCGESMTVKYAEFSSSQDANRYFNWNMSKTLKVFTQGSKAGSDGKQIGYRAEALVGPKADTFAVMWTNGAMFRAVYGRSLPSVRALEKQYSN